jgi:glutathione S-transferase
MMTYLVEKYGQESILYPKNPAQRAKVDQQLYFDLELYSCVRAYYSEPLFQGKTKDEEVLKKAVQKIDSLEQTLDGQHYVAGDHLSLGDIALAGTVSTAATFGHDFSTYPNIGKWLAKCKSEIAGYEEINQAGLNRLAQIVAAKASAPRN